jgi:phosphoglycolate phosphatase
MTAVPLADAPVQLVVFDLMGTLIADGAIVSSAYNAALQQAGITIGSDSFVEAQSRIVQLRGRPTLVVLTDVLGDPVIAEEATWAFDDSILDAIPRLEPIVGAHDILASLDADRILTAVTTSFTPEVRKAVLGHMGWTDSFAATLSAHGTRRGHPAPDLLLGAILELRIDSVAQVAIVGDSASDLEAGNRAGAGLVIGVRSGDASEASLLEAPHTHLIDSVAELRSVLSSPRTRGARRSSDH